MLLRAQKRKLVPRIRDCSDAFVLTVSVFNRDEKFVVRDMPRPTSPKQNQNQNRNRSASMSLNRRGRATPHQSPELHLFLARLEGNVLRDRIAEAARSVFGRTNLAQSWSTFANVNKRLYACWQVMVHHGKRHSTIGNKLRQSLY